LRPGILRQPELRQKPDFSASLCKTMDQSLGIDGNPAVLDLLEIIRSDQNSH
jgi:hypothetical protein